MAMTAWAAKFLHQFDLLVGERTDHLAVYADDADQFALLEHRHQKHRSRGRHFDKAESAGSRFLAPPPRPLRQCAAPVSPRRRVRAASWAGSQDRLAATSSMNAGGALCIAAARNPPSSTSQRKPNSASQIAGGVFQHGLKDRLQLTRRGTDDAQYVRGRRLLLQRLAHSLSSRVFSMAMTAWAAKVLTSSICLSVNGRTS